MDNLCIPEDEVNEIITALQSDNANLTREQILKAITSCCEQQSIVNQNQNFLDCVRERIKMLRIIP